MAPRVFFTLAFSIALLSALHSCAPLGSDGNCNTGAAGAGLNTYTLFNEWKKLSGYTTPRTDAELQSDFDLLILEPGTAICSGSVVNSAQAQTNFRGTYLNDVNNNKITITYTQGQTGTASARYSFSGSCSNTEMTLSYDNGTVETYQLFSVGANPGDCTNSGN